MLLEAPSPQPTMLRLRFKRGGRVSEADLIPNEAVFRQMMPFVYQSRAFRSRPKIPQLPLNLDVMLDLRSDPWIILHTSCPYQGQFVPQGRKRLRQVNRVLKVLPTAAVPNLKHLWLLPQQVWHKINVLQHRLVELVEG